MGRNTKLALHTGRRMPALGSAPGNRRTTRRERSQRLWNSVIG
jgi:hypothetical protein